MGQALSVTPDGPDLTTEQVSQLWAQAEPLLKQLKQSTEEKSAMWIPNIGQTAGLLVGAVVMVVTPSVQAAENYIAGRCKVSLPDSGAEISPTSDGGIYLFNYHRGDPRYQGFTFNDDSTKVTLVVAPTHGKVVNEESSVSNNYSHYYANEGYYGQDRFVMQVEKNGVKVRIQYLIEVPREGEATTYLCEPASGSWKISSTTPSLDNARLQSLFDATNINNSVNVTFADLPSGAVGQTTGTSITLDTNAAGNGWFIDPTPTLNEEWLPTSNPNEWKAKLGSAAYNKMDMLSVLLHEYGHALGIEHSADQYNFMATTLTAGVRRLPSGEELALMQQLITGIKTDMAAVTTQGSGNTPTQLPLIPLGGFGLAFLGRLRGTRYGGINIVPDPNTLVTQYSVTANAKLTNGSFVASNNLPVDNGWATQGSVDFTGSKATLQEVTTRQTRLNQVFAINPTDRYLSFTLSGSALDNVNGAPDDAFEVALLDANTGLSLLGSTGLSHSDAFLNIQADGTEYLGSQASRLPADGTSALPTSRTYRVDLSGIAAGTAVNLSFDLIGFGKATSHITVSNVRVSGLPELHDDAASMVEDGTLAFDPFAQVDNAALLQLGSHVVDVPAHGNVTVNADGTFVYTPAHDYFGTDSFSYRLNDGSLESNLATVSVTIAAVNDAPVAGDVYATIAEDTPLLITLGSSVRDVDSINVTTQIVTNPAHGVLTLNNDGSYTYTPNANYNGTDSFTYQANDGAADSNLASVNINVTPVNDAPVTTDMNVITLEDNALLFDVRTSVSDVRQDTGEDPTHKREQPDMDRSGIKPDAQWMVQLLTHCYRHSLSSAPASASGLLNYLLVW
jgi:VCBS repeat-containing protein